MSDQGTLEQAGYCVVKGNECWMAQRRIAGHWWYYRYDGVAHQHSRFPAKTFDSRSAALAFIERERRKDEANR